MKLDSWGSNWHAGDIALQRTTIVSGESVAGFSYSALVLLFVSVHVLIGMTLRQSPTAAGVHAGITLALSIWAALRWSYVTIASCAGYIVGSEVLWRMTGAPVPYELGKYAVSLLFVIALIRMGRQAKWRPIPLIYFLLLLPSAALVLADQALLPHTAIMRLSFNLSGPLALCTSVWFFSQHEFRRRDILRICTSLLGPLVAIAVVTVIATRTSTDLVFTDESNLVTSGGFGPNQVSAALGLGTLVALLFSLNRETGSGLRLLGAALVLLFLTQGVMTFSRGGLYSAALALLVGMPYLLAERRVRRVLIPLALVIGIVGSWVILPRLEQFTGGKLGERFQEVQMTNRGELASNDMKVWFDHPLLGVGPGMVRDFRDEISGSGHTEYTRLLAEHGSFGLLALVTLILMSLQVLRKPGDRLGRGYCVIFLAWATLSMMQAGMRIAAFGFIFGLAHATLQLHRNSSSGVTPIWTPPSYGGDGHAFNEN